MKVVAFGCAFLIAYKIKGQFFFNGLNPNLHFLSDSSTLYSLLLACVSAYLVFISFLLVKPSEVRLSGSFSETLRWDTVVFYQYLKQAGGFQTTSCTFAAFCTCCQVYPSKQCERLILLEAPHSSCSRKNTQVLASVFQNLPVYVETFSLDSFPCPRAQLNKPRSVAQSFVLLK